MSKFFNKKGLTRIVRVRDRRRYGTTTYTWLEVELINPKDGKYYRVGLGDPWACISPKAEEVNIAIKLTEELWYSGQTSDAYLVE